MFVPLRLPGQVCHTVGFCSPLPPAWPQTIIFQAVPAFLCFPSTFLPWHSLVPVTPLLPYHGLFLQSCLAHCLWSHYIQHCPASSNSRSSMPVFIRCLCQYILTHGPMEISMLWETWQRGGTGWESALWKWPCLPWQRQLGSWIKAKGRKSRVS